MPGGQPLEFKFSKRARWASEGRWLDVLHEGSWPSIPVARTNKLNRGRRIRISSRKKLVAIDLEIDSESKSLLPQGEFGVVLILFRWEDDKDYDLEALEGIMSVMDNGKVMMIFVGTTELAQILHLKMNNQDQNSYLYGFKLSMDSRSNQFSTTELCNGRDTAGWMELESIERTVLILVIHFEMKDLFEFNCTEVVKNSSLCFTYLNKLSEVEILLRAQKIVVELSNENAKKVVCSSAAVLLLGYTPWYPRSAELMPKFAEAATMLREMGSDLVVAKLDAERHEKAANLLGIKGFPTILLFIDGSPLTYRGGFTK
ncbi:protein disulfide isomerase-like 1-1 [Curcuma longa]|uniref:protein disulfide isomerase-like 1-1 n=1 Tax=Curcuma longa TaxID=136217 RepID=UPI003D9EBA02